MVTVRERENASGQPMAGPPLDRLHGGIPLLAEKDTAAPSLDEAVAAGGVFA